MILKKVTITAAKRVHLEPSDWLEDWWVGYGKDESCQFEGRWLDIAIFAAKVLQNENTKLVAPNLYRPDIELSTEQACNYTTPSYQPNEWRIVEDT